MSHPSASTGLLLPFGSLTGVIPLDAVPRGRALRDFGAVLGCDRLGEVFHAIPSSVEPVPVVAVGRRR